MILLRIFATVVTLPFLAVGAVFVLLVFLSALLVFLIDVACGEYDGWTLRDLITYLTAEPLEVKGGRDASSE